MTFLSIHLSKKTNIPVIFLNKRIIFFRRSESNINCTCPKSPSLGPSFALDSTSLSMPRLYFTIERDSLEGYSKTSILSSDEQGCSCSLVALLSDYDYGMKLGPIST